MFMGPRPAEIGFCVSKTSACISFSKQIQKDVGNSGVSFKMYLRVSVYIHSRFHRGSTVTTLATGSTATTLTTGGTATALPTRHTATLPNQKHIENMSKQNL